MSAKSIFPALLCLLLACTLLYGGQDSTEPSLQIDPPDSRGWVRLSAPEQTNRVYRVDGSADLRQWAPLAVTHDGLFEYPDAATELFPHRFYRLTLANRSIADDWKNQVHFPMDAFLSGWSLVLGPDFRWIKFAILLNEPHRVYYQDSQKFDFHYDFARQRLEPFVGMTPTQFDQVALRTNQQQVLLGTLLLPPWPNESEYGIQFVGLDEYPPEFVSRYFDLVKSTVVSDPNVSAFYVPVYEQTRSAETHRSYFESRGIRLASADRWIVGDNIYSSGWALGRLKFFPGSEINAAFADGRLLPQDILLTDGVPAEIPVLAGVLTLKPSTPNSHVAILAKSFGIPFAYLADSVEQERVQQLVGKDVLVRLEPNAFLVTIRVTELDSAMDPALRAEILALKAPPLLEIVGKAKAGKLSASTDELTPADIKYFGGKASNFGFLRRQIPSRSPEAIAFSFDLWDDFMDQSLPGGQSLRAEIEGRLAGYSYPPENMAALKQTLADIRSLITGTARFDSAQKQAILGAIAGFSPDRKIRFRSSTNVEDSEQFTGAGLYDSFSGCPADDLDADDQGPSHCDATQRNERGVFRAIQRVYASFYNDNAYIERLRHRVDEAAVGMALLVHYSAPDEIELANGVAALQIQRGGQMNSVDGDLVTQKGAISVTNPDGAALPEVIQGYHHSMGSGGFLKQRSSLVPLGAYVLDWDAEYKELMGLFASVADAYHGYFPQKKQFTLDFEYKKLVPGVLSVKQVREVPVVTQEITDSFLVHQPNDYWVMQGEAADVFSNHRLKSFWSFQTRNLKLARTNLMESLYRHLEATYLDGIQTNQLSGPPASLPNASHSVEAQSVSDRWTLGTGAERRDFELRTHLPLSLDPPDPRDPFRPVGLPNQSPVFTLPDFRVELLVNYASPQPALRYDFDGLKPVTVTNEYVVLQPRRALTSTNYLQQRIALAKEASVHTSFYWPAPPSTGIGEKTAPLVQWKSTRIEGLTSEPIELRGDFSQTYRPGHHNFSEEFIFEPALEPGIAPSILSELEAANVKLIYVSTGFEGTEIWIIGRDGTFRTLDPGEEPPPKRPGD